MPKLRAIAAAAALLFFVGVLAADEGMWLFNNPPVKALKQRYGFEPSKDWLEHVQRSSVRFNSGGSGSFVSPDGLVMTNHHVASDCIQKISTKEKDYIKTGFHARSRAEEMRCVDEELNVLASIEDVTARIEGAVNSNMDAASAQKARRAIINAIEKESLDKTGLRSDVVTLYNGGQYHLYRLKKYTDVRLAFAPEKEIAFFGGDPDNFEFPRYDLDVAFFRVYENDRPARIEHYLKWSSAGAKEGELVFVSGHPGRTDRQNTIAHLEFIRDVQQPFLLNLIRRREVLLSTYSEQSPENARQAQDDLFGYENSRKARLGMLAGLQDPSVMSQKQADEKKLRDAVMKDAKLREAYGGAWNQAETAIKALGPNYVEFHLYERGSAFNSRLFTIARTLVRLAEESKKPNADRLREYSEAGLESLKQELFSEAPVYPKLETVKLADSLSHLMEMQGADNPRVREILGGKSPKERAAELVNGSRLAEVPARKRLADGGESAIRSSTDPMIRLALLVDEHARKLRLAMEQQIEEPLEQAYGKLAKARFAVYGSDLYPDATFTLRLAFGQVKGYTEQGRKVAWTTTIGGTFDHAAEHGNKEPFSLPKSWIDAKPRLKLATPFNFVSTVDIIGGNSGSPVVNRAGELVGIIFDGNMSSLVWDYVFSDEEGRAIAVHSAGILEALRTVYRADDLIGELTRPVTRTSTSGI